MDKYYKTLEVHPNATEQEVKQAYRDLVKIWHPDRFMHDVRLQKRAEEKLKEINDAYQRIIAHLNNSYKPRQPHQSSSENQEKTSSQQSSNQPYNGWICPECLRTNYIYNLTCSCGLRTNEIEVKTYRADQTAADLYDAVFLNISMGNIDRATFLARYLLRRYPNSKEAEIIRNDLRGEASSKQTRPNKGHTMRFEQGIPYLIYHLKKNRGLYIVLSLILIVIIISVFSEHSSISKQSYPEESTKVTLIPVDETEHLGKELTIPKQPLKSEPVFTQPIQPLPRNGSIKRYTTVEAIAPLRVVTRESSHHYFVKIVDWYTGKLILTVFIRSGQSVSVDVPLGSYKLKYATGQQWYGTKFLFGPETAYSEADKKFDFEVRGDQVSGYTVELILQPHGNLKTNRISAEQF